MSGGMHPDLVKITEIFLVPSSFLVAALGTADSNLHRASVSLLGLLVSSLWWLCSREAGEEHVKLSTTKEQPLAPRRITILIRMPWLFIIGWLLSTLVHLALWNRPLGN